MTITPRARWLALVAALLGWMFDGLEMGLFPLVGRPALRELLDVEARAAMIESAMPLKGPGTRAQLNAEVGLWFSVINAGFLIGAATGGVLFGWLGDRIGRVRAMTFSVLVYAGCSGLCAFVVAPWQMATLRFAGALGMGGEWALGVALVMEMWPNASRGWLAGLIGAFGNFGYLLLAVVALSVNQIGPSLPGWFDSIGISNEVTSKLTRNGNWRLLMLVGAVPALLTLFLRLFVPESVAWKEDQRKGLTSKWSGYDLLFVLVGAMFGAGVLALWILDTGWVEKIAGTIFGVTIIGFCYLHPARQFLKRSGETALERQQTLRRMLLAAALSGVPLLATWGGVMWVYNYVDTLTANPDARPLTQAASAFGAAIGSILAALLGDRIGRRPAYALLCVLSAISLYSFYSFNTRFDWVFVLTAGVVGMVTASFYGWLPLYLPELFRTRMRATGQGFGYNFGRILASIGSLQTGALLKAFGDDYTQACSVAAGVYVIGFILIWFAPETKGKPLPD